MKKEQQEHIAEVEETLLPDLTDADEARKAFIVSEILNRKY